MEADHDALRRIRDSLQAEDYQLHVIVRDDIARVTITAGPAACPDCLVGKDLMRVMLAPALGVPAGQHRACLSGRSRKLGSGGTWRYPWPARSRSSPARDPTSAAASRSRLITGTDLVGDGGARAKNFAYAPAAADDLAGPVPLIGLDDTPG